MNCSSCGAAVKPGLSYCNRCGAELTEGGRPARQQELPPESLVWAITAITIVGLGGVIGLMAVMKKVLHFNEALITAFTLLFFLSFLGADVVFIWLLLRSKTGVRDAYRMTRQKGLNTKELGETKARPLPEPALSVTEHTTRTLEPVDGKHKTE
jgi:uncharacterized paraquat-inducible protein A